MSHFVCVLSCTNEKEYTVNTSNVATSFSRDVKLRKVRTGNVSILASKSCCHLGQVKITMVGISTGICKTKEKVVSEMQLTMSPFLIFIHLFNFVI
jgi:hypothetical protein